MIFPSLGKWCRMCLYDFPNAKMRSAGLFLVKAAEKSPENNKKKLTSLSSNNTVFKKNKKPSRKKLKNSARITLVAKCSPKSKMNDTIILVAIIPEPSTSPPKTYNLYFLI